MVGMIIRVYACQCDGPAADLLRAYTAKKFRARVLETNGLFLARWNSRFLPSRRLLTSRGVHLPADGNCTETLAEQRECAETLVLYETYFSQSSHSKCY